MVVNLLRRLWSNIGVLLLAFLLAIAVWVSAVLASDPNVESVFPRSIPVELINAPDDMTVIGDIPANVQVGLRAPESIWERLVAETGTVRAVVNLEGLEPDEYELPIEILVSQSPVQVVSKNPTKVSFTLEELVSKEFEITPLIEGEPALGYRVGSTSLSQNSVILYGRQSLVEQVSKIQATYDISDARTIVDEEVELQAMDADNQVVFGLELRPSRVKIMIDIVQVGGYRDVAVAVETIGQPVYGYRVTNISVTPPIVTIFSSDVTLVQEMPGFVRTQPLDLTDLDQDLETRLALNLPEGVSVVGEEGVEQSVMVSVGIAAIESSVPASIQVEVVGLQPGYDALVSPEKVDVILSGPLPVLDALQEGDVRVFVDLNGLGIGIHSVEPLAEILPSNVNVESFIPTLLEVEIVDQATPTITPEGWIDPTVTITPTVTFTPVVTPTPASINTPTP
jgi:YbbR domain-containing protein